MAGILYIRWDLFSLWLVSDLFIEISSHYGWCLICLLRSLLIMAGVWLIWWELFSHDTDFHHVNHGSLIAKPISSFWINNTFAIYLRIFILKRPRPSVCLSVTFSFRSVTQIRISVFSQNFAGMCTMSWGCKFFFVVLASESIGGRSRATELPCFINCRILENEFACFFTGMN